MNVYPSNLDATGLRFGVVVSRFNHSISAALLEGCVRTLEERGASPDAIDVAWVPGAFEIPQAARVLAESGHYDALVTLGSVIRGGTPHFDYVCIGVTDGVREVMRDAGVPVAFGVLTLDDVDQALERIGGSHGHKGEEVALAAVEMARLVPALAKPASKFPARSGGGRSRGSKTPRTKTARGKAAREKAARKAGASKTSGTSKTTRTSKTTKTSKTSTNRGTSRPKTRRKRTG